MDKKDFESIVGNTKLAELSKQAAFHLFVEKMRPFEVSEKTGLSPSRVSQISSTFRQAQQDYEQGLNARIESTKENINVSLHDAIRRTREAEGSGAVILPARPGEGCIGDVIVVTAYHAVQKVSPGQYRVHELAKLDRQPETGKRANIKYDKDGFARVTLPHCPEREREGRGGR